MDGTLNAILDFAVPLALYIYCSLSMKNRTLSILRGAACSSAALLLSLTSQLTAAEALQLMPYPAKVEHAEGVYQFPETAVISQGATRLNLETIAGLKLTPGENPQVLLLKAKDDTFPKSVTSPERHQIQVTPKGVAIRAAEEVGYYRALQTLAQMVATTGGKLPLATVTDYPRFEWRGFMLDESRHFTGKDALKKILDEMAAHKMNRFHWHLTDSQGWRIEIKKYPKLTTVGAIGNNTNPKAPAEFYTQEEIKEIVAYAKARHITIVPEIDMPGHAAAAVRAYPEFSGGGSKRHPDFTFNPASKETETFLLDILKEVAQLFPDAKVIHFGGDESHFGWEKWPQLPAVKALMKEKGYKDLHQVEHDFNRRMAKHINDLGFTVGGWDEISRVGLDKKKTLLFWWRHNKPAELDYALKNGYQVVLCPRIPCYFDFVQHKTHKIGRRWGSAFVPLDAVYAYPDSQKQIAGKEHLIKGVQANLWTEQTPTQRRREFMIFPRLHAIASAGWVQKENKDYERFLSYMNYRLPVMQQTGLHHASIDQPNQETAKDGKVVERK
ncbi:hexosaminidase [Rubritalea squalenifaciens DSM 18772]|uniref:beta-N-acetylhexosaminidase n=2 Tax=Rubritalea squalenifaciens TaxID=407226 RepID=A0A1M6BAI9_9BACT|nr:hexosaminidase [Rubritalea squalenifaciens DSM 18772]